MLEVGKSCEIPDEEGVEADERMDCQETWGNHDEEGLVLHEDRRIIHFQHMQEGGRVLLRWKSLPGEPPPPVVVYAMFHHKG